ncbi:hypothetical protein GCM10020367_31730 [Streptomyces sannanensis]|uniref:Transposase n=1 Tax=Streptomyces sannanensis TaxID=285536 RepID=A0ABP6SCJ6_9ACTN
MPTAVPVPIRRRCPARAEPDATTARSSGSMTCSKVQLPAGGGGEASPDCAGAGSEAILRQSAATGHRSLNAGTKADNHLANRILERMPVSIRNCCATGCSTAPIT